LVIDDAAKPKWDHRRLQDSITNSRQSLQQLAKTDELGLFRGRFGSIGIRAKTEL